MVHQGVVTVREHLRKPVRQLEQGILVEPNNNEDQAEHRNAQEHCTPDADAGCLLLLLALQLASGNRHEQEIVNSENDFQEGQRRETAPESGRRQKFKHGEIRPVAGNSARFH